MNIKINKVKYVGTSKNQTIAYIIVDGLNNNKEFGYFVSLDKEDNSEIYKSIISKIKSGEVKIEDTEVDISKFKADEIRIKRNKLLDETDKYMTTDYPISRDKKTKMKEYRQLLRDITKQEGFPDVIEWPEKPTL